MPVIGLSGNLRTTATPAMRLSRVTGPMYCISLSFEAVNPQRESKIVLAKPC